MHKKPKCCIHQCKNRENGESPGIEFYRFPAEKYKIMQRQKWIEFVRKHNKSNDWYPHSRSIICSAHFIGKKKSLNSLSPSYVPTISVRISDEIDPQEKLKISRYERAVRRKIIFSFPVTPPKEAAVDTTIEAGPSEAIMELNIHNEVPLKVDMSIQVDLFDPNYQNPLGAMTFMSYSVEHFNDICHVQTQMSSPELFGSLRIVKKRNSSDKCCGADIVYKDKGVGPDEGDVKQNIECQTGFHGFTSIPGDQQMLDLCGVTINTFKLLLKISPQYQGTKVSRENRLLILLMKLKLGTTFSALAALFRVSRPTISRIFYEMVTQMRVICDKFVFWPNRDVVQETMPQTFRENFPRCRVIIDCFEVRVEQPKQIGARVHLYSHYKKGFTTKVLVGTTPGGAVSFISKCCNGRMSDCQITVKSKILDCLEPGDLVLADKGFPNIVPQVNDNGEPILLVMPPYLRDPYFSAEDVEKTYNAAKHRIHIERIIQRFRIYKILDKLTHELYQYADDIVFMIGVLVNLQPPILKDGDHDSSSSSPSSSEKSNSSDDSN